MFSNLPIRRVEKDPVLAEIGSRWPANLPPVRELLTDGLPLGQMTVLVGENGTGKSTVVEAIAQAFGLNVEGGSISARHQTFRSESNLSSSLRIVRNPGASKYGYFLRAETMHGLYTYLDSIDDPGNFHEFSHGESFIEILIRKFRGPGLWVLDEPESALSFQGCLALIGHLKDLLASGDSQVILSTHSPLLASFPNADIYELGDWGIRKAPWEDLAMVQAWKSFLDSPERFLRHL